jgi:hypothetical protein
MKVGDFFFLRSDPSTKALGDLSLKLTCARYAFSDAEDHVLTEHMLDIRKQDMTSLTGFPTVRSDDQILFEKVHKVSGISTRYLFYGDLVLLVRKITTAITASTTYNGLSPGVHYLSHPGPDGCDSVGSSWMYKPNRIDHNYDDEDSTAGGVAFGGMFDDEPAYVWSTNRDRAFAFRIELTGELAPTHQVGTKEEVEEDWGAGGLFNNDDY